MALGMIATIGGVALAATFARDRFMSLSAMTEVWRGRAGFLLETVSSILVFTFGAWTLISAINR
jgi:ABC-type nickel/cobalt efflux system permease component RcnA